MAGSRRMVLLTQSGPLPAATGVNGKPRWRPLASNCRLWARCVSRWRKTPSSSPTRSLRTNVFIDSKLPFHAV